MKKLLVLVLALTLFLLATTAVAAAPDNRYAETDAPGNAVHGPLMDSGDGGPADAKTTQEMTWWELFLRSVRRDYVVGYIVLLLLAFVGLFTRMRRLRYAMLIVSLLFLGFYIGLRLSSLGGPSTIILISLAHTFKTNFPYLLLIGIVVICTLVAGRTFCGWACPMGALQQLVFRGSGGSKQVNERLHKYLRYLPYLILLVMVITTWAFDAGYWGPNDPFRNFFRGFGAHADELALIPSILFALLLFASLLLFTPWCRYVCPLGAMISLFAKVSLFKVKINEAACTDCKRCSKIDCAYQAITEGGKGIKPKVNHLECTACGECINHCPDAAISLSLPSWWRR